MEKQELEIELEDILQLIDLEKEKIKPDYGLIKRLIQDKSSIEFKLGKY
jgi:hypothetical protein